MNTSADGGPSNRRGIYDVGREEKERADVLFDMTKNRGDAVECVETNKCRAREEPEARESLLLMRG
jgi:hypothetical protein